MKGCSRFTPVLSGGCGGYFGKTTNRRSCQAEESLQHVMKYHQHCFVFFMSNREIWLLGEGWRTKKEQQQQKNWYSLCQSRFSEQWPILKADRHNIMAVTMATEWPFVMFPQLDPNASLFPPSLPIDRASPPPVYTVVYTYDCVCVCVSDLLWERMIVCIFGGSFKKQYWLTPRPCDPLIFSSWVPLTKNNEQVNLCSCTN